MYKFLRAILFLFDPEWVHYFSMNSLKLLCKIAFIKKYLSKCYQPKCNGQWAMGNGQYAKGKGQWAMGNGQFRNRVGLAAGFDKNAAYLNELEILGFGFVEIGTVTPLPQPGNDKPRLFRLPKDKALINRMGFNNDGVEMVAKRLKEWKERKEARGKGQGARGNKQKAMGKGQGVMGNKQGAIGKGQKAMGKGQGARGNKQKAMGKRQESSDARLIIGGNIGKNKTTPNELAWQDYKICFEALHDFVDYFVVNVSSPNTPGLRELQEKDSLHKILTTLQQINTTKENPKPILLKISPDLTLEQLDDVIDLALQIKLDGLVATNTTISRDLLTSPISHRTKIGAGGLSGLPLQQKSTEIIKYIHQKTSGKIPIIGSGGIFTGDDAKEKLAAGASLVQVWTGFIYEGPKIVKKICSTINSFNK